MSNPIFRKVFSFITDSSVWLTDALPLEVYSSKSKRVRALVDDIYAEICLKIEVSSPARTKEAIKTVLINLWIGASFNRPVRYSRDRGAFSSPRRYGQLFFKYDRFIPVIDTLSGLGYIQQKIGFFIFDKDVGFQTRMWATKSLIKRFEDVGLCECGFFNEEKPKEPIILKDDKKDKIQYPETPKISKMRAQVERYNNFIDNSKITVVLNKEVPVTIRFLLLFLYQYVIKGTIRINTVNLLKLDPPNQYLNQYHHNTNSVHYHNILSTMTKRKHWKHQSVLPFARITETMMLHDYLSDVNLIVRAFDDFNSSEAFLNQSVLLNDIGIERIEFQLVYECLHRVFNDASFSRGGRFYGALHQSIPKEMRRYIQIDGQSTVELDYSAFHIMMLYHMAGIDYQDDPYSICEGPGLRKIYKAVGLIAINAETEQKAYGAISEELEGRRLNAPKRNKPIVCLVNAFKQAHMPIKKHLFSGVGTKLQNIDSVIMNSILTRLLEMNIVGLPIHDSVIVQTQYQDILKTLMVEEYQKRMGFTPIVDVK
ncbi:MAG: hypothetical protein WC836_06625 [Desulfobacula sp.]